MIVMLSVPFALVGGAAWLMWGLAYNMSVAVAVGFIRSPASPWNQRSDGSRALKALEKIAPEPPNRPPRPPMSWYSFVVVVLGLVAAVGAAPMIAFWVERRTPSPAGLARWGAW